MKSAPKIQKDQKIIARRKSLRKRVGGLAPYGVPKPVTQALRAEKAALELAAQIPGSPDFYKLLRFNEAHPQLREFKIQHPQLRA